MTVSMLLILAVAGGIGAVARCLLAEAAAAAGIGSPWGIATINLLGCFGFGLCWELGASTARWSMLASPAVLAGFFGAFTTFSSFAFDGMQLWSTNRPWLLLANALLQNVFGLLAMAGGVAAGRSLAAG
jgi:fluoride exporter